MQLAASGVCSNCAQPSPVLIQFRDGGPVCLACIGLAQDMLTGCGKGGVTITYKAVPVYATCKRCGEQHYAGMPCEKDLRG